LRHALAFTKNQFPAFAGDKTAWIIVAGNVAGAMSRIELHVVILSIDFHQNPRLIRIHQIA
jgi:hypothetical protein